MTVRTYSNEVYWWQFAVSRITTLCSSRIECLHTVHSTLSLICVPICLSLFYEQLAAEQSGSKFRTLFSVDSIVADGVSSQNFRNWSAEASSDWLIGWAKSRHTEPSNWSAAKRIDDDYQGKWWSCWISSGLTTCVRDRPCFTVFRMKIEQNSCVIVKFNAILGISTIYAN